MVHININSRKIQFRNSFQYMYLYLFVCQLPHCPVLLVRVLEFTCISCWSLQRENSENISLSGSAFLKVQNMVGEYLKKAQN